MDYDVKAIHLTEDFERYSVTSASTGPAPKDLPNLSKINIFVGENNSGKSKFLRQLAAIEKLQFVPNCELAQGWTWNMVAQVVEDFGTNIKKCFASQGITEADGILKQSTSIKKLNYLEEGAPALSELSLPPFFWTLST